MPWTKPHPRVSLHYPPVPQVCRTALRFASLERQYHQDDCAVVHPATGCPRRKWPCNNRKGGTCFSSELHPRNASLTPSAMPWGKLWCQPRWIHLEGSSLHTQKGHQPQVVTCHLHPQTVLSRTREDSGLQILFLLTNAPPTTKHSTFQTFVQPPIKKKIRKYQSLRKSPWKKKITLIMLPRLTDRFAAWILYYVNYE